jgi:hypothetical protein
MRQETASWTNSTGQFASDQGRLNPLKVLSESIQQYQERGCLKTIEPLPLFTIPCNGIAIHNAWKGPSRLLPRLLRGEFWIHSISFAMKASVLNSDAKGISHSKTDSAKRALYASLRVSMLCPWFQEGKVSFEECAFEEQYNGMSAKHKDN